MLNEAGLILVVLTAACALVVLGALELVWPTRPRYPVRRARPVGQGARRARSRALLAGSPALAAPEVGVRLRGSSVPRPIEVEPPLPAAADLAVFASADASSADGVLAITTPSPAGAAVAPLAPESLPAGVSASAISPVAEPLSPVVVTVAAPAGAPIGAPPVIEPLPAVEPSPTIEPSPVIVAPAAPVIAPETPAVLPVAPAVPPVGPAIAPMAPAVPPVAPMIAPAPIVPPAAPVIAPVVFTVPPVAPVTTPMTPAVPPGVPEVVGSESSATELPAPAASGGASVTDVPAAAAPPALRIVPPLKDRGESRRERPRSARGRPGPRSTPRPVLSEPPAEEVVRPKLATPSAEPPAERLDPPASEVSIVERCVELLDAKRFPDVVTLGEEALRARKSDAASVPSQAAARETSQLWGMVGLAKQELDDVEGARFAFEEAIAVAPGTERPTWERRLASLALTVGRRSLAGDEAEPPRPVRVDALRSAIDWLERGLMVAPDDAGLRDALAAAREALWPTSEAVVKMLLQRQDFAGARRILDEALADPDCPPERRSPWRQLHDTALSGEAGQATAEALVQLQRGQDDEAAAALAHAESVMASMSRDALPAHRRQELERRLWSGYVKLGVNRVEAGEQESAMGPLVRALSLTEIGSERPDVAKAMLARALGEIVDRRSAMIGQLIDAGDVGIAAAESDKLWSLLRGAVDQGLPEDDALEAFDKVLGLYRRLGGKRA